MSDLSPAGFDNSCGNAGLRERSIENARLRTLDREPYIENEVPQPQVLLAFGLLKVKPLLIRLVS